jgi:DNA-binding transcriptional MocR family regulator
MGMPILLCTADQGEPVLLDAIEEYLAACGRPVPRGDIQVTASGTTATNIILSSILNAGDEVVGLRSDCTFEFVISLG